MDMTISIEIQQEVSEHIEALTSFLGVLVEVNEQKDEFGSNLEAYPHKEWIKAIQLNQELIEASEELEETTEALMIANSKIEI